MGSMEFEGVEEESGSMEFDEESTWSTSMGRRNSWICEAERLNDEG